MQLATRIVRMAAPATLNPQRLAPPGPAPLKRSPAPPPPPRVTFRRVVVFFTGPWTVTRSPLRMLRRVAAFWRPLRPVLLLVSFPHSRSRVAGVPGLCWMWRDVPFARQRRPPPPPKGDPLHG